MSLKQLAEQRNSFNMPTYFQLGRNSVGENDKIFKPNLQVNKGLRGHKGITDSEKRFAIPVTAKILASSDSRQRLNLAPSMEHEISP